MSYYINKNEARATARNDLTIFDEVQALMKQVITDAGNGLYQTTVSDATTMTESTPSVTVIGASNPTITGTPTLIIAGHTTTLGSTGTNLNSIIADINDALIPGLVASKNTNNNLILTYEAPASTTWSVEVGSGTANTELGLTTGITNATNPSSVTYNSVWQGDAADRAKTDQMNQVELYFKNLGYSIERVTNSVTGKTFKWVISY
tara:strand:- start:160 stop:777 length:618 start_codon:yes stop_codon:yes gene_type:complete